MGSIKRALARIVGPEWVTDDPVILSAYGRDAGGFYKVGMIAMPERDPDFVVLPENTEQVQRIAKLANREGIPIMPASTNANVGSMSIGTQGGIRIDFKRMNQILQIDELDMKATVQPGVTYAALQAEAHKRGLETFITAAPATGSPVGNSIFFGTGRVQNHLGMAYQQILSVDMVLADGRVLKTGSKADFIALGSSFWQGPGPDLTYLPIYVIGSYGIVTQMDWKLHPRGAIRHTHHIFFSNKDDVIAAHNELAKTEMPKGLAIAPAPYYGQRYADNSAAITRCTRLWPKYVLALCVEGSERQVEYEEEIIEEVVEKYKGRRLEKLPTEVQERYLYTEDGATRGDYCTGTTCAWAVGARRQAGFLGNVAPSEINEVWELFNNSARMIDPEFAKGQGRFDETLYIYTHNWGHCSLIELIVMSRPDPMTVEGFYEQNPRGGFAFRNILMKGGYGMTLLPRDDGSIGSRLGSYYEKALGVKRMLDPNDIMNPGLGFP